MLVSSIYQCSLRLRRLPTFAQSFTAHQRLTWTELRHIPSSLDTRSGRLPHSREPSLNCPLFVFFLSFFLKSLFTSPLITAPLLGQGLCVLSPDDSCSARQTSGGPLSQTTPKFLPKTRALPLRSSTSINYILLITFQAHKSTSWHWHSNTCTNAWRFVCSDVWCNTSGNNNNTDRFISGGLVK